MDIQEIRAEELKIEQFAFMDMTSDDTRQWLDQPIFFDGIVVGLCTRGSVSFRINYREYRISSREMFLCLPRCLFTITGSTPDFEAKLLLVSPDFLYALPVSFGFGGLKRIGNCPCLQPSDDRIEDLIALYTLLGRYDTTNEYAVQIRTALMLSFILIVISQVETAATDGGSLNMSRQEKLTHRFFDLMLQHYETQRSILFYADKLCTTAKYLSAVIKSTTGHPAQSWINEALLVEAKRCLKTTDLSVLQISEKLHFSTASSFVRFFRQHTGTTPLAYRKG